MGERVICKFLINGVLIILTFVYLAIGLAVVGLSLWLRLDPAFEEMMRKNILRIDNRNAEMDEVKNDIRFGVSLANQLTISFWVILGCGVAAALIGLIGVCGAMFASRATLILNLITSVMLLVIELAIVLFIILYKPTIEETTTHYVDLADQLSGTLDDMNAITSRFKCCSRTEECTIKSQLTCTTAVWQHLEFNLILAGYFIAGIVIQQALAILLCIMKIAGCA